MERTREYYVEEAAKARSNLNIFHGVIAMLECGTITGPKAQSTSEKIIRLCKLASQQQLSIYDDHVATASQEPRP